MMVDGTFEPGFDCYGIPLGTDSYVRKALQLKAEEVKRDMEQVADILAKDSQALWVALHRSLAHKMDYHLSLCYPSDILPVAEYLDKTLWGVFERAVGQQVPREEKGLGVECVLNPLVDSMQNKSFQEISVRLPIRLRGFGLRSFAETAAPAFIGGVQKALGGEEAEQGWWRTLLESGSRTGTEYDACWNKLQREGQQIATFIGKELEGTLAAGLAVVDDSRAGSCRQALTEQCEELREAALREGLLRHADQSARPVRAYPQLDKLSTAWKLSLPGITNGLSTPVFKEVMAQHLCLPSPACKPILGQPIGTRRGGVIGPFADELMTAHLTEDSWRHRHDAFKVTVVNMCNEARVPIDCEVFGIFRDLIPAALTEDGGELQYGRQRMGLCPDFRLRLPTADGPLDSLGELKFISAGVTRYPIGRTEKQVDRRARELPGTYRRPLERLDRLHHGTPAGEVGRLVQRLQSFGELQTYVVGNWGEGSEDLHSLVQTCAEARVAHICRTTGRQESEQLLGTIVGQYRRLMSTCAVRAQAMCTLARVGLITPAARDAARRRQGAMRLEVQMREERRAQWMASLQGPGWARRGRCHGL